MATLSGTSGNDSIAGTTGDDVFDLTQGGDDTVLGVFGNDVFVFGSALTAADYIDSGMSGRISLDGDYSAGVVINARSIGDISLGPTHSYNLTLGAGFTPPYNSPFGISAANLTAGNTLAFDIAALAVVRYASITGSAGNDTLDAGATAMGYGRDTIAGGAGNDSLRGYGDLYGQAGDDTLFSYGGGNVDGGDGNDLLTTVGSAQGGAGDDTLIVDGATAVGELEGGAGRDSFVFKSMLPGSQIRMGDFAPGETIDLSAIAGLTFIGAQPFSGIAGQVNYAWTPYSSSSYSVTSLQIDTNGDALPDASITLDGELTFKETTSGSKILQWTADITPPTLLSTLPWDNDTLVPLAGGIELTFNEIVGPGTGNIEVRAANGTLVKTIDVATAYSGIASFTLEIDPGSLTPGASYYITIDPGAFLDLSGNAFVGISSPNSLNFTAAPEAAPPSPGTRVTGSIANDHPIDQDFVFTFSAPVTGWYGDIILYDSWVPIETIPITDQSRVTISGNTVIVNPAHTFAYGLPYEFQSTTQYILRDYAGQGVALGVPVFTTEQGPDGLTRPVLVSTSPTDDTANVNVNSSIVLSFDHPVTFGAGQFEFRRADGALVQAIGVADSSQVIYSGNTVTVHPTTPLAPGVTYSVLLASGAIRDVLGGNSFAGITSPTAFNFITTGIADTTAPNLVSASPADNAANVSVGTDVTLHFSEAVQPGSGNIEIHNSDGSLFKVISITDPWQVKFAGSNVTIDPNLDLSLATGYYVIVPSGAIMDYAGNTFAGISSPTALNFGTTNPADTVAPVLRYFSPIDDENDVRVGDNIVLMFSETVKAGAGNAIIHRSSDGSAIATITIGDASQVAFDQNSVTINPSQDLASGTAYYVTLDAGLVTDLSGNPYAGSSSPTGFNFTTVPLPDLTPPLLLGKSLDNATGVGLAPHIVLTFNEAVHLGTGNFLLHNSLDDSVVDTIWSGDTSRVVVSGNTVTLAPFQLHPGTSYYLTMVPGVITDVAGNSFAGIPGKFDLNFTTAPIPDTQPPQLLWSSPSDNKIDVPVGANITLTFDEAVKAGAGNIVLHRASDNSSTAFAIGDTSQVSIVGNSITINPQTDLAPGDHYYLTVDPGVILDSAGNSFAGINARTTLDFRIAGSSPSGLHFNITYDQDVSLLPAGFVAAVLAETQLFAARYTDPVTINLHVGYGFIKGSPMDPGALAESAMDFGHYSYSQIRNAIAADASSNDDLKAFNSLPVADPTNGGTFSVASAEAAALGLPNAPTTVDGYIGFSNAVPFDYNSADGVTAGTYDFAAAVAHEVSEVMGRELGAGFQGNYDPLDLFDYWSHQLAFNTPQIGSFSVDNGYTSLMRFNTDPSGDAGDWDRSAGNDAFDAFGTPGAVFPVSQADFVVMDALGYDQVSVPVATPLLLLSTSPSDDAFQVPVAADITLMFNQTVEAGSGRIVIHSVFDGSAVETIPVTDAARVSFSGSTVTINPAANLPQRSGFYVTIDSGAITDLNGVAYAGIASPTALNFTTGDAVPIIAGPMIAVIGAGQQIAGGDTTPSTTDATDFVSFPQGNQSGFHIFTVRNDGGSTLTLGPVNLPAGFSLLDPLVSSLGPGASDTFSVQLDTSTPGTSSGQVSFTTNDSSENPFTFAITGTVTPAIPTISIGNTSVTEGGVLSFAVTLNRATSQDITLNYDTSDGTATVADNDYIGGPGTLVIHAGQSSGTITIQTVQDSKGEPDETISVQLQSASYGSIWQATGTGTILNDDPRLNGFFSGDGRSEILCQNDDGRVAVWLLDQTLQTSKPVVGTNPGTAWHVKGAGDFDGDGKADILWQNDSGQAAIWLMDGATKLGGGLAGANPGPTWHVKGAGDFNGDGKTDILWQNDNGSAAVWLMDGTTLLSGLVVGGNPGASWHVKGAGDFNGDGKSDILWQNDDGRAGVWLMDGMTQISGAVVGGNPGASWHIKGAGDFNGDGKSDILWQNDDSRAAVWLLDGTTQTSAVVVGYFLGASWHVREAQDLNGDGKSDIVWQHDDGSAQVWKMDGTTLLNASPFGNNFDSAWHIRNVVDDPVSAQPPSSSLSAAKTVGDVNGDGMSDILWQNDDGRAAVWLMNAASLAGSAVIGTNPGSAWHVIGAGDFNADHKSDILWQNDDGSVQVWLLDGTSQIGGAVVGGNPGPSWHAKGAGDFNGDGKADILWQNDDGRAGVWLIDGTTQTAGALVGGNPGPSWHVKGAGDFNGDGKADILWQNDNGQAAIWLMDGTTELSGALVGGNPGPSWHVKGAGDFNGDGKADILWQNDNGQAAIWLMNGTTELSGALAGGNPGPSWHVKGAEDFNGDGKSDIVWQNDSGQAAIWLMDGTTELSGALAGGNPGPAWHIDWA